MSLVAGPLKEPHVRRWVLEALHDTDSWMVYFYENPIFVESRIAVMIDKAHFYAFWQDVMNFKNITVLLGPSGGRMRDESTLTQAGLDFLKAHEVSK